MQEIQQKALPSILTINDFCKKHTFLTPSALRNKIFYGSQNRMDDFKVTIKLGKRVYINENNFFLWLDAMNGGLHG
ncbi:MAG: hypothetical protein PHE89_04815 [Alphaproteobacteria bacterium]|nr:hypothetical protein [Alphaproteobacteria bacterium]